MKTNKPDWKDAPEWAQWVAQDADGAWFWFERPPVMHGSGWSMASGRFLFYREASDEWSNSLEERPKASPQS